MSIKCALRNRRHTDKIYVYTVSDQIRYRNIIYILSMIEFSKYIFKYLKIFLQNKYRFIFIEEK